MKRFLAIVVLILSVALFGCSNDNNWWPPTTAEEPEELRFNGSWVYGPATEFDVDTAQAILPQNGDPYDVPWFGTFVDGVEEVTEWSELLDVIFDEFQIEPAKVYEAVDVPLFVHNIRGECWFPITEEIIPPHVNVEFLGSGMYFVPLDGEPEPTTVREDDHFAAVLHFSIVVSPNTVVGIMPSYHIDVVYAAFPYGYSELAELDDVEFGDTYTALLIFVDGELEEVLEIGMEMSLIREFFFTPACEGETAAGPITGAIQLWQNR